jgi:hypothetical protein
MRLAMTIGALMALLLVPAGDLAAQRAQPDRPVAGQQRPAQVAAAPQRQRAVQPRSAASRQPAQAPRQAASQSTPPRPAAAQASRTPQTAEARPPQRAAAPRTGLMRSAAASPAPAGMPRTTGTCTRRDAQGRCVRTTASNTRWQGGLPPMTMAQQDCPSGTVATLARGHSDVVRCLPI